LGYFFEIKVKKKMFSEITNSIDVVKKYVYKKIL